MKEAVNIRITSELRAGLNLRSEEEHVTITAVLERYIRAGLAHDNGILIQENALPHIRAAVREEVQIALAQLTEQLTADLTKAARRSDDRLANLTMKAVRQAGLSQRMVFALTSKLAGRVFADESYEFAREATGKDLTRKDLEGEA